MNRKRKHVAEDLEKQGIGWKDSYELINYLRTLLNDVGVVKIILCDYLGHAKFNNKDDLLESKKLYDGFFRQLCISKNFRMQKKYTTMYNNIRNVFDNNKETTKAWIQGTAISLNSSYLDIHQADTVHIKGMWINDMVLLPSPSIMGLDESKDTALPEYLSSFFGVKILSLSSLRNRVIALDRLKQSAWSMTRLEIFNCNNLFILPHGLDNLVNLRVLKCRECGLQSITDDLQKLKKLEVLDLYKNRLTDISVIKGMKNLTSLNVGDNPLLWDHNTDELIESLTGLTHLDVSSITEDYLNTQSRAIFDIYHEKLIHVNLSNRLAIDSNNVLNAFPKLQSLTMFGKDIAHLLHPRLLYNRNPEYSVHGLTELDYSDALALPECLNLPELQTLKLHKFKHCNLGPVHQFEILQHLDISHSYNIKDLDKEVLCLRFLVHLNISFTQIRFPDEAFPRLEELVAVMAGWTSLPYSVMNHKFLRKLDISSNHRMDYKTAIESMYEKLPLCEVIFNTALHVY